VFFQRSQLGFILDRAMDEPLQVVVVDVPSSVIAHAHLGVGSLDSYTVLCFHPRARYCASAICSGYPPGELLSRCSASLLEITTGARRREVQPQARFGEVLQNSLAAYLTPRLSWVGGHYPKAS
jgi:hypothetical protein